MKNCNLLIPGLHKECPSYMRSFECFWVIFALLDPDQPTKINADPDPKLWALKYNYRYFTSGKKIFLQRYHIPVFLLICLFALGWAEKL
jgi:hypothetical protein